MWIFCGGMSRSGSTVQYQIVSKLVEDSGLGKRIGWVYPNDFPTVRDKYSNFKGWKVIKSHVCTNEMVEELETNFRGVYIYRDLRGVFLSLMMKDNVSFNNIWFNRIVDKAVDNYYRWTDLNGMMISRYNELIEDMSGEVAKIASHLEIEISMDRCQQIADEFSIKEQKKRIENISDSEINERNIVDSTSLLHGNHISNGAVDSWRDLLKPKQIAMIERRYSEWLENNSYVLSNPDIYLIEKLFVKVLSKI